MTTADGRSQLQKQGREMVIPTQALMLCFRIELRETEPLVWRALEVPGDATALAPVRPKTAAECKPTPRS